MLKKPKKITVQCYGPIAVSRKYESLWEDVWLIWTDKPGRKKHYLAPALCSRTDIERELKINKELQLANPDNERRRTWNEIKST